MENIFMLIGGLSFGIGMYLNYEKKLVNDQKITPQVAKHLISNGATVLDVRTQAERNNLGFYQNSIHIPAGDITEKLLTENNIEKNTIVVLYCNSGTRARKAALKLKSMGYTNAYYIVETYKALQT